jgi:SAM-dependent methyltransferase
MGEVMIQADNQELEPVRAYWNTIASHAPEGCRDHWVDNQGHPLPEYLYDEVASYVAAQLPQGSGTKPTILEVGCGTGRILAGLQKILPAANLWGIDVSEGQIRDARSRLTSVNLESQDINVFVQDRGRGIQGACDLVFMHSVTQYFPSTDYFVKVLHEATELLRPCGTLCLIDVPIDWYYEQMRGQPKKTLLTPLKKSLVPVKRLVKAVIGYESRPPKGPCSAIEVLDGKRIEVPIFAGYWASPESIESFAKQYYSGYIMEYQSFSAKPIHYKKYRPIFLLRNRLANTTKPSAR